MNEFYLNIFLIRLNHYIFYCKIYSLNFFLIEKLIYQERIDTSNQFFLHVSPRFMDSTISSYENWESKKVHRHEQDTRDKTLSTRHKTLDRRHKTLSTRHKTLNTRHKTLSTRHKTQDTKLQRVPSKNIKSNYLKGCIRILILTYALCTIFSSTHTV